MELSAKRPSEGLVDEEEVTMSLDSESNEIRSIDQLLELIRQHQGVGEIEFASKRYKIRLPVEDSDICSPESPTTLLAGLTTRLDPTSEEPLDKDPDNPFTVEQTPNFETEEDSTSQHQDNDGEDS